MTRYIQFANNAVSRLAGNLSVSGTTLSVQAGEGDKFPLISNGQFFMATLVKTDGTSEIVKVTARSGDVFTIMRAADRIANAQVAYAFSAGDRIENRLVAQTLEDELDRLERLATPTNVNRVAVDTFTGSGTSGPFSLAVTPSNKDETFVYVGGVYQNKATYSLSGPDLTLGGPVATGITIEILTVLNALGGTGSGSGTGSGTGSGNGAAGTIIEIVDSLPAVGAYEGQIVMLNSNSQLYVWTDGAWVSIITSVTGLGAVEIVDALPVTDNFEGRMVLLSTDGKIYTFISGAYVPLVADVTTEQITRGLYTDGLRTIEIVDTLPTTGNVEGRMAYLTSDQELYIYKNAAWVMLKTEYTPDAPTGIEVVSALPTTGNYADRTVFLLTDNKLYKYISGTFQEVVQTVSVGTEVANGSITTAKFASGITPVEIVTTLPTTSNFEGRLVFLTTDSKLYRYNGTSFISGVATSDLTGTIGADQIAANAITAGKIAAGAISATEIAAGAITTAKLAAGAITAEKIAALAVTADSIAAGAITAGKIATDAIVAGNIQAGAIGASQIAADAITTSKLAANSVAAANIQAAAITAAKIAANAVTATNIAAGAITAGKIATDAIVAGNISAGAVGASQIAANAITAGKIAAGVVTATNIASGAITSAKIAAGAITADKLTTGSLITTSAQIDDGIVGTLELAGNAVTVASSFSAVGDINNIGLTPVVVISGSITVSGTQPILVDLSSFTGGAVINGSPNTQVIDVAATVSIGTTTQTIIPSVTILPNALSCTSASALFTGIVAGTYTVSVAFYATSVGTGYPGFLVRNPKITILETKR